MRSVASLICRYVYVCGSITMIASAAWSTAAVRSSSSRWMRLEDCGGSMDVAAYSTDRTRLSSGGPAGRYRRLRHLHALVFRDHLRSEQQQRRADFEAEEHDDRGGERAVDHAHLRQ